MDIALQEWMKSMTIPCWISTMTTCASTTIRIPRESMINFQHPNIHVRVPGKPRSRRSAFHSFANSISCVVNHNGKKATIKLFFSNGTLHVTGCKDCQQSLDVMDYFSSQLGRFHVVTDSFQVQLINIVCKYIQYEHRGISLGKLLSIIKNAKLKDVQAHYDPDIYVGLKIKIPSPTRSLTLLVFNKGCVILSGFRTQHELYVLGDFLKCLEQFMTIAVNENDVRL